MRFPVLAATFTVLAAVLAPASASATYFAEAEPNDTTAQADVRTHFPGDTWIAGGIEPVGDVDKYRFDLATASTVRIETSGADGWDCAAPLDNFLGRLVLRLFNGGGTELYTDTGTGGCAALVVFLPAGTYYVGVEELNGDGHWPAYYLQLKVQADRGAEVEPNDSVGNATPLPGSDVVIAGSHQVSTDKDYYAITIPFPGASVRAEVIEGGAITCESLLIDSKVGLHNALDQDLTGDDDNGRGYCSRMDGAGGFAPNGNAVDLAPGTYYLVVESTNAFDVPKNKFDYRLVVQIQLKNVVFRDTFTSNDLSAWSTAATDGGDLTAATGTLEAHVNDTHPLYAEDQSPVDDGLYRAEFGLDTRDFDPGMAQGHFRARVFIAFEEAPTRRLLAVVLKRQGSQYSLMARARLDSGAQSDTGFFPLTPGNHYVEVAWRRATSPAAADGQLQLWIDETLVSSLGGLQNAVSAVDFVRLGALSLKTGASGTLAFNEFQSHRYSYIIP